MKNLKIRLFDGDFKIEHQTEKATLFSVRNIFFWHPNRYIELGGFIFLDFPNWFTFKVCKDEWESEFSEEVKPHYFNELLKSRHLFGCGDAYGELIAYQSIQESKEEPAMVRPTPEKLLSDFYYINIPNALRYFGKGWLYENHPDIVEKIKQPKGG